ncbi:MAG: T9SS type A sorting domain-containing protein [Saprospiraceae bacterium]|nr:T9SS type A sorting domain-containing protein [Saprospiraceae bacterium]
MELSLQYFGKDSNNNTITFSGLVNENNDVIIPNYVFTITLTNGQEKLISNSDIYSLPGLVLEHTYAEPYIDYFDTGTPACNGGYFININFSTLSFKLYNIQHQLVKNLPAPVISPGFNIDYARYTDDFGDGSTDFNYTYSETDYNNKLRNIYVKKEDGTTLFFKQYSTDTVFSFPNFIFTTSNLFLTPKFFITVSTQDSFYSEFYTLPSLIKEKALNYAAYFNTEPGIAKYGQNYLRASETSAKLFNQNDWSVYQEFTKPAGEIREFKNASKYIFDADSEFELLNNETNGGTKRAIVRNMPDQNVLFQETGFELGDVSILPGLGNKLICIDPGVDPNKSRHNVYTLPSSTPVSIIETSKEQLAVSISPNPSIYGNVMVNFEQMPTASIDIRVFNAQGMLTQQLKLPATEQVVLPATCFPTQGLYFVSIASGDWKAVAKLIRS